MSDSSHIHQTQQSGESQMESQEGMSSMSPPAFQLLATPSGNSNPIQGSGIIQRVAEDLTPEELAAANQYNSDRYRYEAPNDDADDLTSYQRLINALHAVAGNQELYDAAAAATSIGTPFANLVNAAQGELYPENADSHDGQLGPQTLRDVMAQAGIGSTAVGLEADGIEIPENQVNNTIYPHFSNDRIGDFYVTGGFMEPHGHSNKPESQSLRSDGLWMEDAPLYNSTHVTANEYGTIVGQLHTITGNDALRDAANTDNASSSPNFARLVYEAQLQLFTPDNDIDGRFGPGTRAAVEGRAEYIDDQPQQEAAEGEGANADQAPAVDPFIYQMAPYTELFETRTTTAQNGTIGVNFNLNAEDAQARIEAAGADYAQVVGGAALTNDQINTLYYQDLQTLGLNRATAAIANFDTHPLPVRMAVVDICFSFGTGAVAGMDATFAALAQSDYHAAADALAQTAFHTNGGDRGRHHVDAIRLIASRRQDPRITTQPPSDRNYGFDYVTEGTNTDEEIFAWYGGVVTFSGWAGGYGNRIIIETDIRYTYNGEEYPVFTAYAHNDENFVQEGDFVEAGDSIGEMGGTGGNYGAHVDLRIWIMVGDQRVDLSPNVLESQLTAAPANEDGDN